MTVMFDIIDSIVVKTIIPENRDLGLLDTRQQREWTAKQSPTWKQSWGDQIGFGVKIEDHCNMKQKKSKIKHIN